jgi:hypothetical protein
VSMDAFTNATINETINGTAGNASAKQGPQSGASRTATRWRVGTFSMGVTLLLAGVALFISQWKGIEAFDMLMAWWPTVLVLLGLEIIGYIALVKKENPIVHYDVFSILFVGVLCIGCLIFTFLTSTGLMGEVRLAVSAIERSVAIPEASQAVPSEVSRIVVVSNGTPARIDMAAGREVHLFGTFRYSGTVEGDALKLTEAEIPQIRVIGDTMYVTVPELPRKLGINRVYPHANITIVVPNDVKLDMRGSSFEVPSQASALE